MTDPVLSVEGMSIEYGGDPPVRAVRDVDLRVGRGEVVGIAGESGCGKSTLAYGMTRLLRPPARVTAGSIWFDAGDGERVDVGALSGEALREFRWNRVAMVFQSAMNALNPVLTVGRQLEDVFEAHRPAMNDAQRRTAAAELLELVGIDPDRRSSYPHELSGGMRQRVMIAMALALRPDVVIMDEPTTALDVVVQRDILNEIDRLRREIGFAVVFITHDLGLLMEISDRIAIMYAGRIVEEADAVTLRDAARHPYTVGLLNAFPALRGERRELRGIPGVPPDLAGALPGCSFAPRCPYARAECRELTPRLIEVDDAGGPGRVACLLHDREQVPEGPPRALLEQRFRAADSEAGRLAEAGAQ